MLSKHQQLVVCQIFAAVVFSAVTLSCSRWMFHSPNDPTKSSSHKMSSRFFYTIRWQIPSVFTLFAAVHDVARRRFHTAAIIPADKAGFKHTELPNRILQNTLEQFVINAAGQLVICTYMDDNSLHYIPTFVFLFVFGRIMFWLGYNRNPLYRGFGFALTFVPTNFLYVCCLYCMYNYGMSQEF